MRIAMKGGLQIALPPGAHEEQPDCQTCVAAAENHIRPGSNVEQLRCETTTASAPAVAASAVRHQASQVRSAAIDDRRI